MTTSEEEETAAAAAAAAVWRFREAVWEALLLSRRFRGCLRRAVDISGAAGELGIDALDSSAA